MSEAGESNPKKNLLRSSEPRSGMKVRQAKPSSQIEQEPMIVIGISPYNNPTTKMLFNLSYTHKVDFVQPGRSNKFILFTPGNPDSDFPEYEVLDG